MRRVLLSLGLALAGCGGPIDYGTAVFAVDDVPEEVATISVFVREAGKTEVVASATVSAPSAQVSLGVPAERPLEITAVARSEQTATPDVGGLMPVYVARALRTVPLGRATSVALDARPGGGLAVRLDGPDEGGALPLVLDAGEGLRPIELSVPTRGARFVQVLAAGRWGLRVDDEAYRIAGGAGLWVAPGAETQARLRIERVPMPLAPDAPRSLELRVLDEAGEPLEGLVVTSSVGPTSVTVELRAFDGLGALVPVPPAEVVVRAVAVPTELVAPARATTTGLSARLEGWQLNGVGRVHFEAEAELGDGRTLRASWHGNVGAPGGPPAALGLELHAAADLVTGARLRGLLLDAEARLADVEGWDLDASESDGWAFFAEGATARASGPVVELPVARPSGPLGRPVTLRAVATSTTFAGTSTASLALPLALMGGGG